MINAFSEYLNGYATVFALCLSVPVIILIFFVVEYRRLKRDVATINNLLVAKSGYSKNTHCKNVHGKNAFNPRIKLHSKASTSLWNSISALLAKHQNIDQHKNTYNEIIALTSSLTDKITNISQVKQSIVELLAKQLGSGVVSIMLIGVAPKNHPDKTASLNIDATYGLNIKRLQDLILTTFENLVLFHKQACGNTAKVKKMCEVDKPSKNFSNKFNYLKNSYSGSHREIGTFAVLPYGLGDPLLARIPAIYRRNWVSGHLSREIPEGYRETIQSGQNKIVDENLREYYDILSLIARSQDLFAPQRLKAIMDINLGRYDHLIDRYLRRDGLSRNNT